MECYTCRKSLPWKGRETHAGHFTKSFHRSVKFDEHNVKPQCRYCNTYRGGEEALFQRRLIDDYGLAEVDRLLAARHVTHKFQREELEALIEKYKCSDEKRSDARTDSTASSPGD